jgi:cellulose synthase/poly-beta-1,6-N-acetylglucosamine synthase-like glycosyltransferase
LLSQQSENVKDGALTKALSATVLVPTFRRPADLKRCLLALQVQSYPPDEILVVLRPEDEDTQALLRDEAAALPKVRTVFVEVTGQVAALNAGLDAADTDLIAITDDDTAPRLDWLERIVTHFSSDSKVGGVGGRDWVHEHGAILDGSREIVGKVSWFGRTTGNHHLGVGGPRFVEILKGANMSYRRAAIGSQRFDTRLRGAGAQVNNDLAFSLSMAKTEWKLVYDPEVAVDHYPSVRFDEDQRQAFNPAAVSNAAHNETLSMLNYLSPPRRIAYLVWAFFVGTRVLPGLVQVLRLLPAQKGLAPRKWAAVQQGRRAGWSEWLRGGRAH